MGIASETRDAGAGGQGARDRPPPHPDPHGAAGVPASGFSTTISRQAARRVRNRPGDPGVGPGSALRAGARGPPRARPQSAQDPRPDAEGVLPPGEDLGRREGGQSGGRAGTPGEGGDPAQTPWPRADVCSQAPSRREPGPRVLTRPACPQLCQKPRPAPPGPLSARGAAAAAPRRRSGARQGPGRRPARGDPFPHKIPPRTRAWGPGKGFEKTRTGAPTCKLSDRPPPPPPQNGFKPLRASRSPPAVQARAGSAGRGRPVAGHTPSRRCHGDARASAALPGRPGSGTSALEFPRLPTLGGVVMTTSGSLRSLQAGFPAWRPLDRSQANTPRMTRPLWGHCCPRVYRSDRSLSTL